jgi:hypothetical protein
LADKVGLDVVLRLDRQIEPLRGSADLLIAVLVA